LGYRWNSIDLAWPGKTASGHGMGSCLEQTAVAGRGRKPFVKKKKSPRQ